MRINEEPPKVDDLKPTITLLSWMTLCYLVGFVGYLGRTQGIWFWYVSLRRPDWDLPTWAVTPIWTFLYGVMGFAAVQVWRDAPSRIRSTSLAFFCLQLALSGVSPWVYFAWHQQLLSVCLSALLWVLVLATALTALRTQPRAGKLLWVYLASLTYLWVVQFTVMRWNP